MKDAPCFNCKDRKPLCHKYCENYHAFADERADFNERKLKSQLILDYFYESKKNYLKGK